MEDEWTCHKMENQEKIEKRKRLERKGESMSEKTYTVEEIKNWLGRQMALDYYGCKSYCAFNESTNALILSIDDKYHGIKVFTESTNAKQ